MSNRRRAGLILSDETATKRYAGNRKDVRGAEGLEQRLIQDCARSVVVQSKKRPKV